MLLSLTLLLVAVVDEPTVALSGRVVDATGAPAGGAEILLAGLPKSNGDRPIVARGKADEAGRFALRRPATLAGENDWRAARLWASRPGDRLAFASFSGPLPPPGEEVRLALPPRGRAEFRVEGPDGRPVAGAKVRVKSLAPTHVPVPEALAARVEATTDAEGRATIEAVGGEQVAQAEVEADGFGLQPRYFDPPLPGPRRIALRPAAALEGRFVAEDGRPLRGWKVSASTTIDDEPGGPRGPAGRAESIPLAEDGSFRFPAIAAGALGLWVDWPDGQDPDVLPAWPKTMEVRVGRANRVEIPLRRASEVAGVIRERGTGKPIEGVKVYVFRQGESTGANATTDAQGRYSLRSLPGKVRGGISEVPPEYIQAPAAFRDAFEVPPPPARAELPAVELGRAAPPLTGVVRDAAGKAVAGAAIGGTWTLSEDGGMIQAGVGATADAEGRFAIGRIAPEAQVSLTARAGTLATRAPVAARGGQDAAVTLTVEPSRTLAVAGRVVDEAGRPLAGAAVRFNAQVIGGPGQPNEWFQVPLGPGVFWLYTGPDGTFRTPPETRRERVQFQAEAVADGYQRLQTPWQVAGEAAVVRMPDVVLRRAAGIRSVVGRVVDAAGAGIAGATVLQRGDGPHPTEATTGDDGRFRLPGVAGGRALLVAEARGFRTGGAIAGLEGPVEIRLARDADKVPPLARAPEPLTRAEERALGLALLEPLLKPGKAAAVDQYAGAETTRNVLARLAPDRGLAMLEERVLPNAAMALVQIALARFEDDPAAAVATLDADRSGNARVHGLIALADLADAVAPGRRAEMLDRALEAARAMESTETKVQLMGEVADRWLESYDLDRAAPILREGRKLLDAAGPELFAFQAAPFGEALGAIDPKAAEAFLARKAVSGNQPGVEMRDRAELAVRVAVADPATAEGLARRIHQVPNFYDPPAFLLRIARNMARADLPRARAVLALLDDPKVITNPAKGPLPAYGLALLAEARAATDPDGARALLDESFAGLRALAEAHPGRPTGPPVAAIMASLLPLVERLEPDRTAERLWTAVACRPGLAEPLDGHRVAELLWLALLVARYDRAMAAVVAAPALGRMPELAGQQFGGGLPIYGAGGSPIGVLAAYDPPALADLIRRLPEAARVAPDPARSGGGPSFEDRARREGARMLSMPPEARRRAALESPFGSWPVRGNGRSTRVW